ncbi:MAG: HNH endonuclease [Deltaproteobacteria bacterium]
MRDKLSRARSRFSIVKVRDIFARYSKYYLRKQKEIRTRLDLIKELPKGTFIKKNINGHQYYYLAFRQDERVVFKYVGKNKPPRLAARILNIKNDKKFLIKRLEEVQDALYSLGITKRIPRGDTAKRFAVFKRDNFRCRYCGKSAKESGVVLSIDHAIPKKRGGTEEISNLVTACLVCNLGKNKQLL